MRLGSATRQTLSMGALVFAAVSCGNGSSEGGSSGSSGGTVVITGGTGGSSGSTGGGGAGGSGGAGARDACPPGPGVPGATRKQHVGSVRAQVVDLEENAAVESPQVCGIDLCVFIEGADAAGNVTTAPARDFDRPSFKNGLGIRYAKFAYLLPDQPDHDLGFFRTVRLPDPAQGSQMLPGAEARSGPATLILAQDAKIEVDILTYTSVEERTFRFAEIPVDRAPPAVDPVFGLELLFALSPVETVLCPKARLVIANSAAWAAGTSVEFFVHGVSVTEEWAPFGGWAKVSDGAVSSDGASISTAEDGGLPVLGMIGIRRKR